MTGNSNIGSAWLPKLIVIALSPVVLEHLFPRHPHLTFGIGVTVGVLLQHFVPPRGKGRDLLKLLALALVFALINTLF